MNENQDIHVPDTNAAPAAPAESSPAAGRTLTAHFDINLALIVALIALLLLALLWINQRQELETLKLEVGRRLAGTQAVADETRHQVDRNIERMQDTNSRLAVLENKLNAAQNQQDAMTEMYQNLAQHRQDWLIAEAEQTLVLAQQQLRIAGNVPAALTALQTMEQRLGEVEDPKIAQLRLSIIADIGRLKTAPYVDSAQAAKQIDALIAQIDALPLSVDHLSNPTPKHENTGTDKVSPVHKFGREIWSAISELISVRRIDQKDPAILSPDQSYFVRQNLRLRLTEARLLLIQRNPELFKADIAAARETLATYFDRQDEKVKTVLAQLMRLHALDLAPPAIDLNTSIAMARELLRTPKPAAKPNAAASVGPTSAPSSGGSAASTPAAGSPASAMPAAPAPRAPLPAAKEVKP